MTKKMTLKVLKKAIANLKKHDRLLEKQKSMYLKIFMDMITNSAPLDHAQIVTAHNLFFQIKEKSNTVFNFPFVVIDEASDDHFAVMKSAKDQIVIMGVDRAIPNIKDCSV